MVHQAWIILQVESERLQLRHVGIILTTISLSFQVITDICD